MEDQEDRGVPASPSGCEPAASAAVPASSQGRVPNADYASDDAFENLMGSISRVYGLRPGSVLTQEDFDAIQHFDRHFREESDNAVEAFSQGYAQGLREGGSADIEKMSERLDEKTCALGVEKAMRGWAETRLAELKDHAARLARTLKNILDLPHGTNKGFAAGIHKTAALAALKRHAELFPASGTEGESPTRAAGDAQDQPQPEPSND